jgi:outer membrane protein assembly factor BamB
VKEKRPLPERTLAAIVLLLFVAGALGGCAGGTRATTWTSLTVVDDVVYAADLEQVHALDAATSEVLWSFPAEPDARQYGPFYTVTILEGETLFVTSYERTGGGFFAQSRGMLRALSVEDGRLSWEFTEAGGEFVAAGAVGDGILTIGNSDGNVYAFDVEDGSRIWTFPTTGRVWATPLVISDTVYVPSLDHNLYALDLTTGQERWRFGAEGAMAGQPLAMDGRLYIGAFDHELYALRREDGAVEWGFEGTNWFWGTPATDGSHIYAADVDGNVYALDTETGSEVWRSELDQPVRLGPVLSQDGKILLVASDAGKLYGLDTVDGFMLWNQPGEGQLASVTAGGEVAYVSRIFAEQHIEALYIENGRSLWVYPQPEAEE